MVGGIVDAQGNIHNAVFPCTRDEINQPIHRGTPFRLKVGRMTAPMLGFQSAHGMPDTFHIVLVGKNILNQPEYGTAYQITGTVSDHIIMSLSIPLSALFQDIGNFLLGIRGHIPC